MLDLDQDASIGEESFRRLCGIIGPQSPRRLAEFGSGPSTVRWALAFPELKVTSFEHNLDWMRQTADLAGRFGVSSRVSLVHAPIRWRFVGPALFRSYALPDIEDDYDVVIIDGPPGRFLRGREACLHLLYDRVVTGGLVVLDDYNRGYEKDAVRNWLAAYPGSFEHQMEDVGQGLAVLRKVRGVRRRFSVRQLWGNYKTCLRIFHPRMPE